MIAEFPNVTFGIVAGDKYRAARVLDSRLVIGGLPLRNIFTSTT